MSSSALTSGNSAIVMIDHATGFGNVSVLTTCHYTSTPSRRIRSPYSA